MEGRRPDGRVIRYAEWGEEGLGRVTAAPTAKTRSIVRSLVQSEAAIFALTEVRLPDGGREMEELQRYLRDQGFESVATGGWAERDGEGQMQRAGGVMLLWRTA